jgi:hypothetical protein
MEKYLKKITSAKKKLKKNEEHGPTRMQPTQI